jgi:hypothetical protein
MARCGPSPTRTLAAQPPADSAKPCHQDPATKPLASPSHQRVRLSRPPPQPRPPPGDCPSAPAPHLAKHPPLLARCGLSPHPHSSRAAARRLRKAPAIKVRQRNHSQARATSEGASSRPPPQPRPPPGDCPSAPHRISRSPYPSRRVVDCPPTRTLAAQPPADSAKPCHQSPATKPLASPSHQRGRLFPPPPQPRPPPGDCPSASAPHLAKPLPLMARCGPSPHPHSSRAAARGLRKALPPRSGNETTRKPEPPASASLPPPATAAPSARGLS